MRNFINNPTSTKPHAAGINTHCVEKECVFPSVGFLRLKDILVFFPVSRSTWWDGVAKGIYPKPVKLSARTTAWKVEDIRALIERIGEGNE